MELHQSEILASLRNPHGLSVDQLREARHQAADMIEAQSRQITNYSDALENLRQWCRDNGLNPVAYPTGVPQQPLETLKAMRDRAHGLAERTAYAYFCACDLVQERIVASNFYEIIRTAPREARE
jgi:hypothetical protein